MCFLETRWLNQISSQSICFKWTAGGVILKICLYSSEPHKKKNCYFPLNTGCLIGILIMVYHNPIELCSIIPYIPYTTNVFHWSSLNNETHFIHKYVKFVQCTDSLCLDCLPAQENTTNSIPNWRRWSHFDKQHMLFKGVAQPWPMEVTPTYQGWSM